MNTIQKLGSLVLFLFTLSAQAAPSMPKTIVFVKDAFGGTVTLGLTRVDASRATPISCEAGGIGWWRASSIEVSSGSQSVYSSETDVEVFYKDSASTCGSFDAFDAIVFPLRSVAVPNYVAELKIFYLGSEITALLHTGNGDFQGSVTEVWPN